MSLGAFERFSKAKPCPLCDGNHSCSVKDGLYFCWRSHGEDVSGFYYLGDAKTGFGMYRREGDMPRSRDERRNDSARPTSGRKRREPRQPAPALTPEESAAVEAADRLRYMDWLDRQQGQLARYTTDLELVRLADQLGVSPEALRRLGVSYTPERGDDGEHWTFWERDAIGRRIGRSWRYPDGRKWTPFGDRRGLTYADDWQQGLGPIFIVEGGSDVAAGLTLGLRIIGRPSNTGGVELLDHLLRKMIDAGETVIVLGENDQKPDGRWPGRDGAVSVASALGAHWSLPPDGVKDLRSWLHSLAVDLADDGAVETARATIVRHCEEHAVSASKQNPVLAGPTINISQAWVDEILAQRQVEEHEASVSHWREEIREWMCPCETPICIFLHKPLVSRILEKRCERWTCPGCARVHREEWLANIRFRLATDPAEQLYTLECTRQEWESRLSASVRRSGAEYFRVQLADHAEGEEDSEPFLVILNQPLLSKKGELKDNCRPISRADAIGALSAALHRFSIVRKPIHASFAWRLPPTKKASSKKWKRRGLFPRRNATDDFVEEVAVANESVVEERPTYEDRVPPSVIRNRWIKHPPDWKPSDMENFYQSFLTGTALPRGWDGAEEWVKVGPGKFDIRRCFAEQYADDDT